MKSAEEYPDFESWLADRPEHIREVGAIFPYGTTFHFKGEIFYLCGYVDSDNDPPHRVALAVSTIDPKKNFDAAQANTEHVCAHCVLKYLKEHAN